MIFFKKKKEEEALYKVQQSMLATYFQAECGLVHLPSADPGTEASHAQLNSRAKCDWHFTVGKKKNQQSCSLELAFPCIHHLLSSKKPHQSCSLEFAFPCICHLLSGKKNY